MSEKWKNSAGTWVKEVDACEYGIKGLAPGSVCRLYVEYRPHLCLFRLRASLEYSYDARGEKTCIYEDLFSRSSPSLATAMVEAENELTYEMEHRLLVGWNPAMEKEAN